MSFRASGQLACFYCGRQSSCAAAPGRMQSFECSHCDATNYLDAEGSIMDPPVATELEGAPKRYVAAQASGVGDSVFCAKCLDNQRLLTSCLAQYSNSRDDFVLDGEYYSFRKQQEQRYPQVCDACAVKVQQSILKAGYTAKTDHLRRMMDMSRGKRIVTTAPGRLDCLSALGAATWQAGFLLQMLWHAKSVVLAMLAHDANAIALPVAQLVAHLPAAHRLASWSIAAGFASAWWNPHFVQVNRGFTRHLLGLAQWYCFQGLIVFFRLASRKMLTINGGHSKSRDACISAHLGIAVTMMLMYVYAQRSIRVDTSMLFSCSAASSMPRPSPPTAKENDNETLSRHLAQTLESPSPPAKLSQAQRPHHATPQTPIHRHTRAPEPDEMDWSPIVPPHRAFCSQPRATGESPGLKKNPFRYPVPPAPFNVANSPWRPLEAQQPQQNIAQARPSFQFGRPHSHVGQPPMSSHPSVEFRPPSFFAQQSQDDDSSLAELLGRSFTISQPHAQDEGQETEVDDGVQQVSARIRGIPSPPPKKKQKLLCGLFSYQSILLMNMLAIWMLAMLWTRYAHLVHPGLMALAGIISLRDAGDRSRDAQWHLLEPTTMQYFFSALGVGELAALCWVGNEALKGDAAVANYGAAILAAMLAVRMLRQRGHG
ncbi:hypothetical protein CDD81_2891 [Ophiocordyceps australis]|uniref:Ima1 N-terminal domain-containing protein n=1 Tax=Ophiocordyceps australis TaxID=1399860 RepID=A0A2C5X7E2_9HYPO|nr:hypothetical protein CDD81_2891 [Ophiocordyceps australis]